MWLTQRLIHDWKVNKMQMMTRENCFEHSFHNSTRQTGLSISLLVAVPCSMYPWGHCKSCGLVTLMNFLKFLSILIAGPCKFYLLLESSALLSENFSYFSLLPPFSYKGQRIAAQENIPAILGKRRQKKLWGLLSSGERLQRSTISHQS